MKTSFTCGAVLFVGLVSLLPSCGSDSSGTADGGAGDDGNPSAGKASGGSSKGGSGSNVGGADNNVGGADSGAGGEGSTGTISADWFCTQVGAACSCIPRPENVPATNTCTQPLAPCCFTFVSQEATNCQCQPTNSIACPDWLSAINGTKVNACPPPS